MSKKKTKAKEKRNKARKKFYNRTLRAALSKREILIHQVADGLEDGTVNEKQLENATNLLTYMDMNIRGLFVLTGYCDEIRNTEHYHKLLEFTKRKLKV